MNSLYTLLQKIKENPELYLGKPSITCLYSFLVGYLSTKNDFGLDEEGSELEDFQKWIQERAKTKVSQSWAGILLFLCGSERLAFSRFFQLFDEFLQQQNNLENIKNVDDKKFKHNKTYPSNNTYDIYELIEKIENRPGMYLGTSSISNFHMLLAGYSLAKRELGLAKTEQEIEFEGFQKWIQKKYKIKSNQPWAKIILFESVDEKDALEKFFELFKQYRNRKDSYSDSAN